MLEKTTSLHHHFGNISNDVMKSPALFLASSCESYPWIFHRFGTRILPYLFPDNYHELNAI
jgi:hypothetical protein